VQVKLAKSSLITTGVATSAMIVLLSGSEPAGGVRACNPHPEWNYCTGR
jgi:hypothetical protein